MTQEQITEQREQAVKRLRSLFDMHSIPFGAPEHLGGLLLSIHENRHFAMDFWSLVNTLSDSGSGELSDEQMVVAVVESIAGTGPDGLPAHERPGADELRQLLAGVDVARPVELPQLIAQPADALLPRGIDELKSAAANTLLAKDEASEKRRSIGDALAKLEQNTRELRAQLAELDAQAAGANGASVPVAAEPVLDSIKISNTKQDETLSKWDRMSPFAETRANALPIDADDEMTQIASPRAEAAPPKRAAESTSSSEVPVAAAAVAPVAVPVVAPVAASPVAEAAPQPVAAPKPQEHAPAPVPVPVFDPRPARTLGQRGLAIPDPDDDPSIKAPFSSYAAENESSAVSKFAIPSLIVAVLAAGAYAGARTAVGHEWLQRGVASVRGVYDSATGHKSESAAQSQLPPTQPTASAIATPAGGATTPDASAATTADSNSTPAAPSASAPTQDASAAASPTQTKRANDLKAGDARSNDAAESSYRQRAGQQMVDASVLRVPAGTMAANLITSRVPAYPESARAQGIEGTVVMDIVVSQTGMVKYARVIDGDRHLRAAAEDAVMRWHYKPYQLNGEPIEVTTTVKLDFRLPE